MADTTTTEAKISIKVFVDKMKQRVVYAEADYTFVDILFSFMTLPLGTIVRLLEKLEDDNKFEALRSLKNLYQSLKILPDCYFPVSECKYLLLNPISPCHDHCKYLELKLYDTEPMKYFRCSHCGFCPRFLRTSKHSKCSYCGGSMKRLGDRDSTSDYDYFRRMDFFGHNVFVSKIANFIVTDDLHVMPYTSATTIRLLTDHGITDTSSLQDIKFDIDSEKMLFLLKMALSTNFPLTNLVFHMIDPLRSLFGQLDLSKRVESSSTKFLVEAYLQKSTGKLLFVEAKHDFIEFLFGFLSIPLGTVVGELLKGESSLRCMENIFESISNMSVDGYLKSQFTKDDLLKPYIGQLFPSKHLLFPLKGLPLLRSDKELQDPRSNGRLLEHCGMFMVTDDLVVTLSSSSSTLNTLNKLNVRFDDIHKYELTIDLKEGLRILRASLLCRSTLAFSFKHQLKNKLWNSMWFRLITVCDPLLEN